MPQKIRAKVRCSSVTRSGESELIGLHAVFSSDPNSENAQWAKYTPSLTLTQTIDNPAAQGFFKEGQEYHLDFIPVEAS